MTVFEMAKHYYADYTPPLWSIERLKTLLQAGKLTEAEYQEVLKSRAEKGGE